MPSPCRTATLRLPRAALLSPKGRPPPGPAPRPPPPRPRRRARPDGPRPTPVDNMVGGGSQGFTRALEINGVGFRAAVAGNIINLSLGFSHPVVFTLPQGVDAKIEKNVITLSGFDKQLVGQVAANIRSLRPPDPYKNKGIRYTGEVLRKQVEKTRATGAK